MASRDRVLTDEHRSALIEELHFNGDLRSSSLPHDIQELTEKLPVPTKADAKSYGTGCLACGEDDDHANLLLCEGCNAEYHTYCLDPPLRSVPMGDFYCRKLLECLGLFCCYTLSNLVWIHTYMLGVHRYNSTFLYPSCVQDTNLCQR